MTDLTEGRVAFAGVYIWIGGWHTDGEFKGSFICVAVVLETLSLSPSKALNCFGFPQNSKNRGDRKRRDQWGPKLE